MTSQQWGNAPRPGPPVGGRPVYGAPRAGQGGPGYPSAGFRPPQGLGPQGYRPQGYGPAASGPQGFGPQGFGPQGFAPQGGLPQYGPGPRIPTPPQRRSPLKLLLLAVIGVAVVALAGLVVTGLSSGPSDVAYQNDSYKVPPPDASPPAIPVPETYDQAEQWVTKNAFYAQTAPAPVRCNSTPINVGTASDDQLKTHFEGLMECLLRVWQPPLTAAGFQIVRPSVTIYGDKMTTKCGTSGVNAFYCSADQQVYYSNQLADAVPIVKQDKWAADVVMAHEFGHALQGRSGILISAHALGQNSGDDATDLQYSRRLETQADCFSGMFMRSVSTSLQLQQSDVQGILQTYNAVGDDVLSGDPTVVGNHGLGRNRVYWGNTGLGSGAVGTCNTFVAPTSRVR